jgi:hypothetical protein
LSGFFYIESFNYFSDSTVTESAPAALVAFGVATVVAFFEQLSEQFSDALDVASEAHDVAKIATVRTKNSFFIIVIFYFFIVCIICN